MKIIFGDFLSQDKLFYQNQIYFSRNIPPGLYQKNIAVYSLILKTPPNN
nr:MAG TPA: hypothetical protein [Caudoviricetes sp.]